jgi:hypothetical protein
MSRPVLATSNTEQPESALSDDLLVVAQGVGCEQQALVETATAKRVTYQKMLAFYIQTKHDQDEAIKDRLESLIAQQQVRLQQTQAKRPGRVTLPQSKQDWQNQQTQQQSRLQILPTRLESIRELMDNMGVHAPKIEELAELKSKTSGRAGGLKI